MPVPAKELANVALGERAYDVTVLSEQGGLVASSAGIRVETQTFGDIAFDTVMFGSGVEIDIVSAALTGIDEPVGWMLKIDILK
jgi:transcriptional regulator GlxA family with amidase domain